MSVAVTHPEPFTVDDLFALPEDGMRHQLLDGTLLVTPPPSVQHQLAAHRLVQLLVRTAPPDIEVLEAPGVLVPAGLLVPDVVVADATAVHLAPRQLDAADVLAVAEVMSPSSRRTDRLGKSISYAEAGITTYWIIDLDVDEGPELVVNTLTSDGYRETARFVAGSLARLNEPFAWQVDPGGLVGPHR